MSETGIRDLRWLGAVLHTRDLILRQGRAKFGEPTAKQVGRLMREFDLDRLDRIAMRVLTARTWGGLTGRSTASPTGRGVRVPGVAMTADDWASGDDLWDRFNPRRYPDRNSLRLLACACARRVITAKPDAIHPVYVGAVDVAERYARGFATRPELLATRKPLKAAVGEDDKSKSRVRKRVLSVFAELTDETIEGFEHSMWCSREFLTKVAREKPSVVKHEFSGYVRDIFGNPLRPVAFDPGWRTSAVAALARGMYDARDFAPMPHLADALHDAGCGHADVLDHCRDPGGVHVRGCWVVDLVLGKS